MASKPLIIVLYNDDNNSDSNDKLDLYLQDVLCVTESEEIADKLVADHFEEFKIINTSYNPNLSLFKEVTILTEDENEMYVLYYHKCELNKTIYEV